MHAAVTVLRDELDQVLADQRLIVDGQVWRRRRADDGFVREVLTDIFR
jgi:hypothetical protein